MLSKQELNNEEVDALHWPWDMDTCVGLWNAGAEHPFPNLNHRCAFSRVYDGDLSCADLLKHGHFGIGTFDRVDGEMVVLDESSIR